MTTPIADVTAQPLVDAIESAVAAAGVAFGDGKRPEVVGTKPFIVAYFDAGTITNRSMRSRDGWEVVGTFHSAGLTPESARIAVRALRRAILGLRGAVIAGREVQMPEHIPAVPMDRDDDADPPLFVQIDEWRIRTSPA